MFFCNGASATDLAPNAPRNHTEWLSEWPGQLPWPLGFFPTRFWWLKSESPRHCAICLLCISIRRDAEAISNTGVPSSRSSALIPASDVSWSEASADRYRTSYHSNIVRSDLGMMQDACWIIYKPHNAQSCSDYGHRGILQKKHTKPMISTWLKNKTIYYS